MDDNYLADMAQQEDINSREVEEVPPLQEFLELAATHAEMALTFELHDVRNQSHTLLSINAQLGAIIELLKGMNNA